MCLTVTARSCPIHKFASHSMDLTRFLAKAIGCTWNKESISGFGWTIPKVPGNTWTIYEVVIQDYFIGVQLVGRKVQFCDDNFHFAWRISRALWLILSLPGFLIVIIIIISDFKNYIKLYSSQIMSNKY